MTGCGSVAVGLSGGVWQNCGGNIVEMGRITDCGRVVECAPVVECGRSKRTEMSITLIPPPNNTHNVGIYEVHGSLYTLFESNFSMPCTSKHILVCSVDSHFIPPFL